MSYFCLRHNVYDGDYLLQTAIIECIVSYMVMTSSQFLKNALSWLGSNLLGRFVAAILFILLTNRATLEETGAYTLGFTYLMLFTPLSLWGLEQLVIRNIAQDRKLAPIYLSNFLLIRFSVALISYFVLIKITALIGYASYTRTIILLIGLTLITENVGMLIQSFFIAFEQTARIFQVSLVSNLIRLGLGVYILFNGGGALALAIIFVVATLLKMGLLLLMLFKYITKLIPITRFDSSFWKTQFKLAYPFIFFDFFFAVDLQIGQVLLSIDRGEEALGLYAAAFTIVSVIMLFSQAYMMAIFPIMSRLYIDSVEKLNVIYEKSCRYLLVISLPLAVIISMMSSSILGAMYPDKFQAASLVLTVLVWSTVFIFLNVPNSRLMVITNHQGIQALFMGVSAVISIVLNLVLLPHFGIIGVALAKVISAFVFFIPNYIFVYYNICRFNILQAALRPTIGAVGMVLCFFLLSTWPPLIVLVLAIGVFSGIIFWLGVITKGDLLFFRQTVVGLLQRS